jgi:nicotinamidase-related amidase
LQNDIVTQTGSLTSLASQVPTPRLTASLDRVRARNACAALMQDSDLEGDPEGTIWPEHCRAGTCGWAIIAELKRSPAMGSVSTIVTTDFAAGDSMTR